MLLYFFETGPKGAELAKRSQAEGLSKQIYVADS